METLKNQNKPTSTNIICCEEGEKKKLGYVTAAFIPAVSGVVIIWRIEINPSGLVAIQLDYCGLANDAVPSAA